MPLADAEQPTTLIDLLERTARTYSDSGIYIANNETDTNINFMRYSELLERAHGLCGTLQSNFRQEGRKIVLLLDDARDFFPTFWACVLAGYTPCPATLPQQYPELSVERINHINTLLDRPLFLRSRYFKARFLSSVDSVCLQDLPPRKTEIRTRALSANDPALLMLTSGSTGIPKAVVLTHRNLISAMRAKVSARHLTSSDVFLNWITLDHVAALLESHLLPVYAGATQVHTATATILSDPLALLRLIHTFEVSTTFSPNFLLRQIISTLQLTVPEKLLNGWTSAHLSCLRQIILGGEAVVVETARLFLELLKPYGLSCNSLWPAFGMTETCAGSVYSSCFTQSDLQPEFASLGQPVDGLQMRIVDERGSVLGTGQLGELQVRGPMVFGCYLNDFEATSLAFSADGWFRTGDIGRIDNSGLSLAGRSKDNIIVNGANYFCQELEGRIERLQGIASSFVAAVSLRPSGTDTEQLAVLFATTLGTENKIQLHQLIVAIRNTTIMLWGFRPTVILPLPKHAFPKTSLGKIQRPLLGQRLVNGEFRNQEMYVANLLCEQQGPNSHPIKPLECDILHLFASILKVNSATLSTTTNFFDLGGTSLDILQLTRGMQQKFGKELSVLDVLQNPTACNLVVCLEKHSTTPGRYEPIVSLQPTGAHTPLFCIHPGNGEVLVLVNLAKYFIYERPFYALRPRGFNRVEECFGTFDEVIDTYFDAIIRLQPNGPYALAGYSLGGPIAFEIAKRFESLGEEVAFLGCIDSPPCDGRQSDRIQIAVGIAGLLELIDWSEVPTLEEKLRTSLNDTDPCEYIITSAAEQRLMELDLNLGRFSTWVKVAHSLEATVRTHLPSGSVKTMTIFRSAGFPLSGSTQRWHGLIGKWDKYVAAPKYIDVPGQHHMLMSPQYVSTFQDIFRKHLHNSLAATGLELER